MTNKPLIILGLSGLAFSLGGCFRYENDPGEGGVTIGEARELDEIAEKLDARARAPGVSLGNEIKDGDGSVSEEAQQPSNNEAPARSAEPAS